MPLPPIASRARSAHPGALQLRDLPPTMLRPRCPSPFRQDARYPYETTAEEYPQAKNPFAVETLVVLRRCTNSRFLTDCYLQTGPFRPGSRHRRVGSIDGEA